MSPLHIYQPPAGNDDRGDLVRELQESPHNMLDAQELLHAVERMLDELRMRIVAQVDCCLSRRTVIKHSLSAIHAHLGADAPASLNIPAASLTSTHRPPRPNHVHAGMHLLPAPIGLVQSWRHTMNQRFPRQRDSMDISLDPHDLDVLSHTFTAQAQLIHRALEQAMQERTHLPINDTVSVDMNRAMKDLLDARHRATHIHTINDLVNLGVLASEIVGTVQTVRYILVAAALL